MAGDGEPVDAYILGVDAPVQKFTGKVIAVIHRLNDVEDKLVVASPDKLFSKEEIAAQEVRTKSAKEAIKLKEKELKVAQEILDKKIEESGGKYTRAQMNEKGSSLRKTDAYKSYKAIAKTVTEAKE
jgi:inorganic pyrophosphatase